MQNQLPALQLQQGRVQLWLFFTRCCPTAVRSGWLCLCRFQHHPLCFCWVLICCCCCQFALLLLCGSSMSQGLWKGLAEEVLIACSQTCTQGSYTQPEWSTIEILCLVMCTQTCDYGSLEGLTHEINSDFLGKDSHKKNYSVKNIRVTGWFFSLGDKFKCVV